MLPQKRSELLPRPTHFLEGKAGSAQSVVRTSFLFSASLVQFLSAASFAFAP